MFRLNLHYHSVRVERGKYRVGDLAGQTLLNLKSAGCYLKGTGQLTQTRNFSVGDVGKVGQPKKGQKMMLAH